MTLTSVAIIALGLFTGQTADAASDSVSLHVVAVKAVKDNGGAEYMDAAVPQKCRGALQSLGYEAYYSLHSEQLTLQMDAEKKISIGGKYDLHLKPVGHDDQGRVRLQARIVMHPKNANAPPKTALNTTLAMAPGKPLNLGGLKIDNGDLIVVLMAK